jgi:tRNA (guanine-N1)-methyltransferase
MKFHLVTLFPEACDAYLNASILGRARKDKKISISYQNPRDFVDNKWGKVDERPYGGGPGMVMQALPVVKAVEAEKALKKAPRLCREVRHRDLVLPISETIYEQRRGRARKIRRHRICLWPLRRHR